MWRNYLIVGLRALARNKTYAFITIAGLAIGMAACLTILMYVRHETRFDRDTPGAERAFQFQLHVKGTQTGNAYWSQNAPYVALQYLKADFAQVDQILYVGENAALVLKDGAPYAPERSVQVSGNLFRIVRFPFAHGNRETALDSVGAVVLTESEARKRFGRTDVVGETITLLEGGRPEDHPVTGVVRDLPENSHLALGMITRIDPQSYFASYPAFLESWGEFNGHIYVSLKPGADVESLNRQLPSWERRHLPAEMRDQGEFKFVNIRDIHLGTAKWGFKPGGDARTIAVFAVVALLILVMACVNFINLATARASQRAREVALRKVLGASRRQLVAQFLAEFLLMAGVAMLLAVALFELAMPPLGAFLGADLTVAYFGRDGILLPLFLIVLAVGLIGGLYPALFLSRFQPATVLKANQSASDTPGSARLRGLLVIGQFAISIGLTVCTAVVYQQTVYARSADPGYARDGILQVQEIGRDAVRPSMDAMLREIGQVPGVTAVGRTEIGVNTDQSSSAAVRLTANAEPVRVGTYAVDTGYFRAMGIDLLAGALFRENQPLSDSIPGEQNTSAPSMRDVVLNALAARSLGFTEPSQAVGKRLLSDDMSLTIIGVVRDSRFRSVREPIEPIMFHLDPGDARWMIVRYKAANPSAVRDRVEAIWKRFAPDVPFEARFSEEIVGKLYAAESARGKIFAAFAMLAIVIASLGLFGLAAFTAERRTKEIGIRKVLGARTHDIVRLLVWQFSKPVILATLIACPVAWWVMRDWLNTFDARVDLGPAPFVLAALIAFVIALGTVAGHAIRVARTNPVHALRYE
ncbi:FtsX-like permease family protein [Sphingomonas gei]|uniref:FtsX-like permease family protein n=1 Tax=Sphingomonas gei TaxID=1395960 RepID=A0A4S1XC41_9SPHN|nr:FtsX-like permease family protein [Sphingomonas gei]TGX52436.1 FtsX-like permease family protein [Sphingomonas gei]